MVYAQIYWPGLATVGMHRYASTNVTNASPVVIPGQWRFAVGFGGMTIRFEASLNGGYGLLAPDPVTGCLNLQTDVKP